MSDIYLLLRQTLIHLINKCLQRALFMPSTVLVNKEANHYSEEAFSILGGVS